MVSKKILAVLFAFGLSALNIAFALEGEYNPPQIKWGETPTLSSGQIASPESDFDAYRKVHDYMESERDPASDEDGRGPSSSWKRRRIPRRINPRSEREPLFWRFDQSP